MWHIAKGTHIGSSDCGAGPPVKRVDVPRGRYPPLPSALIGGCLLICRALACSLLLVAAERATRLKGAVVRTRVRETHVRRLMQADAIGILAHDAECVIEANDAYLRLLGYTREDVLAGRLRWSTLVAPEQQAAVERSVQDALTHGFCVPIEYVSIRQDGSRVQTLMYLVPLEHNPARSIGFVFDLTERKRVEHEHETARTNAPEQREIERRKDEFLSAVIHELRTPLTCLQGFVQLLAERFNHWEPIENSVEDLARDVALARTAVTYATHSVGRITQLVNDLLDDERIRDGHLDLHLLPCDLGAIVEQAIKEQRVLAPNRVICLEPPVSRAVPILADALCIQQVVTNFLTNALKYSQENRPVTVRLEVAGGTARVFVHDEGAGVPHSDQARIWERFHTAAGVTVQSGSGVSLGLGLCISKNIVERHHGQVGVISESGHGATFWFALPLAESDY